MIFQCMDGEAPQAAAAAVCACLGLRRGLSVLENGDAEGGVCEACGKQSQHILKLSLYIYILEQVGRSNHTVGIYSV